jgi:pimeloyl-ACP methyl ester carboxylesterase
MTPSAIVVIPARLSSTRLPRKMLLAETGRPLVEHTWRNAASARGLLAQHPAAFARALIARRPLLCLGELGRPDLDRVRALLLHPGASRRLVESVASRLRDEPFTACLDWLRPPPPPPPRGLRVPVLAIGGREDALVSVAALRRTAVAWNATAHVVPHAGHCPMLGAGWIAVARHVERWLFDD